MDSEVLYSVFGVICLLVIVYKTLKAGPKFSKVQTKDAKRLEILENYKISLKKSLKGFDKDDEARKAKKIMILREYSEELSFNIFFNEDEAKNVIRELSGE